MSEPTPDPIPLYDHGFWFRALVGFFWVFASVALVLLLARLFD